MMAKRSQNFRSVPKTPAVGGQPPVPNKPNRYQPPVPNKTKSVRPGPNEW